MSQFRERKKENKYKKNGRTTWLPTKQTGSQTTLLERVRFAFHILSDTRLESSCLQTWEIVHIG
jgi:hypothetical protein